MCRVNSCRRGIQQLPKTITNKCCSNRIHLNHTTQVLARVRSVFSRNGKCVHERAAGSPLLCAIEMHSNVCVCVRVCLYVDLCALVCLLSRVGDVRNCVYVA